MMTKRNLLKIFIISFGTICSLTACDDKDNPIEEQKRLSDTYICPPVPNGNIGVIAYGNRTLPFVGAGYDVMGDYLNNTSVKNMVLNIPAKELDTIVGRSSFATSYEGVDVTGFLQSIARKNDIEVPCAYKDDLLFTGTIHNIDHFTDEHDYSSQYTFVCEESTWSEIRIMSEYMLPQYLMPYLTEQFKNDLQEVSPQELIEIYGTHVLRTAYLGSRVRSLYRTVVAADKDSYAPPAYYGLRARQKTIFKRPNITTKEPEEEVAKNYGAAIYVKLCGGDEKRLPHIQLTPNKVIGDPMDLTEWSKSLNGSNYALSELHGEDMIPLYEFIADPTKKEQIKMAIQEYIHNNQLQKILTTPIYQAQDGMHHRYFISYKDYSEHAGTTWTYEAPLGGIYINKQANTVPLYQYTNKQNDRFSSEYYPEGLDGMSYLRIAGYTNKNYNGQNTTVLYEIWNGQDDYAYTIEDKQSYG